MGGGVLYPEAVSAKIDKREGDEGGVLRTRTDLGDK